ncbi:hypothetical protein ACLB6M_22275 [Enterobacter hormaechei]
MEVDPQKQIAIVNTSPIVSCRSSKPGGEDYDNGADKDSGLESGFAPQEAPCTVASAGGEQLAGHAVLATAVW